MRPRCSGWQWARGSASGRPRADHERLALPRWRRRGRFIGGAVLALALAGCTAGPDDQRAEIVASPTEPAPTSVPLQPGPPAVRTGEVWVATESGSLVRIDVDAARVVERRTTPGPAHNVTAMPDGRAAATVATRGAIALGGGTEEVIEVGGRPHDVKSVGDGLVVTDGGSPRLLLVDPSGQVGAVALRGIPHDVAVTSDGLRAWVTLEGRGDLVEVDLAARRVAREVPTGRRPHDLLLAPTGGVWVTDWGGSLYRVGDDGSVGGELALGREAHHLAFSADGAELWVTDSPGRSVSVIDVQRQELVARVDLPGAPHHVAVIGDRVAIADSTNGRLILLDRRTRQVVAQVDVGAAPHGVAAVADGPPA